MELRDATALGTPDVTTGHQPHAHYEAEVESRPARGDASDPR